jgi:hypothetical protein
MRVARGIGIRKMEQLTGINRGRLSMIERGIPPTPEEVRIYVSLCSGEEPRKAAS